MKKRITAIAAFAVVAAAGMPLAASAAELSVLCSADMEWCQLMKNKFEAETKIKVSMIRKSAGEAYAKIRAEASNPKSDIWWAGTGDPHLQAANEGLTEEYKSPSLSKQHPWAQKQAEAGKYRTVGVYLGILGFGYNETVLKKKNIPAPQCWKDLVKPEYKDEIEMANPNSSGAAYNALATVVQVMGDDQAFSYLRKMGENVIKYPNAGVAPGEDVGRGEAGVAIGFMHDLMKMTVAGFPVKIVPPCEGTGYEIGSMSIIKGAKNMEEAKKFYEFALRADVQSEAVKAMAFQVPSNPSATYPAIAPRLEKIKTINYDFAKYGSADTRKRLLQRWTNEIYSAAK